MPSGARIVLRTSAEADIPTPDTDQVALFMDSDDGDAPAYKDSAGTVTALAGAAGTPGADAPPLTYQDHDNAGSTETVDASFANVQRLVADSATVTLTLTGAPAAGTPGIVQLWLEQDGTGGRDWAFPGSVVWGAQGEPDWTTRAANDIDLVSLETVDGGTTWVAALSGREGPQGPTGADGADGTAQVSTDPIFDAKGDLPVGTGADASAKLPAGANGTVPTYASGETTGIKPQLPPGYEFDYVASTTGDTSITATAEASADTVITANAITYDGSTIIMLEVFLNSIAIPQTSTDYMILHLFDGSTSLGSIAVVRSGTTEAAEGIYLRVPVFATRRLTPSAAAHTYSVRAIVDSGTGHVYLGAGGSGNTGPGYIRQTKV